jgi:hypothetical protein
MAHAPPDATCPEIATPIRISAKITVGKVKPHRQTDLPIGKVGLPIPRPDKSTGNGTAAAD